MKKWTARRRKTAKIILAIVLLIVAIRIALPFILTKYLNRMLANNIVPYRGHLEDIDLHLYRGAYVICDLRVDSVDLYGKRPFLYAPHPDRRGAEKGRFSQLPRRSVERAWQPADWLAGAWLAQSLRPEQLCRMAIAGNFARI